MRASARLALFAGLLALGSQGPVAAAAADCQQGAETHVWTAPLHPQPGEPLTILAVATDGPIDELQVEDRAGWPSPLRPTRTGGPPWGLAATIAGPARGSYRIEAVRRGRVVACTEVAVGGGESERGNGEWDLAMEALYAAWIERLFDAPPEQSLSYPSLTPVLQDPARNFLYNYFGAGEERKLAAEPDCADLPYYLRSYFAWKMGLPVAWRACNRGSRNAPPRCEGAVVDNRLVGSGASASEFRGLTRKLMDTVHSGSARTALADDATDYYPVALRRDALWPGTVYADPFGHLMVLVKWVPQSGGQSGMLLAVDAQPDNSVTRKRFWEGTFLFAETPSAGAGFKHYRPLVGSGRPRLVDNGALNGRDGRPAFSTEQGMLSPDDFYARMEQLINPAGQTPEAAYAATLAALMEQLDTRITSVDNGEAYMRNHRGVVPMPSGPAIFETTGPWEDFATPSRDMRLLIALQVLEGLPQRIRRYPQLYNLGGDSAGRAAQRIEQQHAREIASRSIRYTRSDGSPWPLTLAEIYDRRPGLEVGYNPNDCVERRWGATPASPDYATCRRQAPPDQRARMEEYRPWFHERRRPPR